MLQLALSLSVSPARATEPSIESETYTLGNGMRVVLAPDHTSPLVAVDIWYAVGSRDEDVGRTGFAHLFEHLMFQGSPAQPDEFFAPLEAVGATINGTTNTDRTNYFEVLPREYLPLALFLEADRMGGLLSVLDQGKLDNQREVVRNERRQRIENQPYGDVRILLSRHLYPPEHGYHHPTIGSHRDLEAASLTDVKSFFSRFYTPDRAVLTLSGDFEEATARALVERYFAPLSSPSRQPALPSPAPPWPGLEASVEIVERRDVPQHRVWLAWHTPPRSDRSDEVLQLFATLLTGGRSSRLVRVLVEEQRVAQEVSAYQASADWSGVFTIEATAAPGHDTREVVAAIDAELKAILRGDAPLLQEELDAAVAGQELRARSSLETVLGRAEAIQRCIRIDGHPDCLSERLDRMAEITPRDVREIARRWLEAPRVAAHILPKDPPPQVAAQDPAKATGAP